MNGAQKVITCSEAVGMLWDYLDHAVTPPDQERVEAHLSFCRTCCGELEFAKELRHFLASAGGGDVPAEVRVRLERFVEEL